jgi:hypothetical protein
MADSITPPSELLKQWEDDWFEEREHADVLLIQAFQAGADRELEACLRYAGDNGLSLSRMRAARRPKSPSLKEQAIAVLTQYMTGKTILTKDSVEIIRRALEALDD